MKENDPSQRSVLFFLFCFCVVKVEINLGQLFDEKWMGKWTQTLIVKKFLINKQVPIRIHYLIFTRKNVEREKYFQIFFFNNFLYQQFIKFAYCVRIFIYPKIFYILKFTVFVTPKKVLEFEKNIIVYKFFSVFNFHNMSLV